jgi:O-antigen/teichoic acid export membrane protein
MTESKTARHLLNSSVVSVSALLINLAAALYLIPFLIHHLGDSWYGTWILIGSILGYFTLLDFGLFSAAERFVTLSFARDDHDEIKRILSTCLVLFSVAGLLALISVFILAAAIPVFITDPQLTRTAVVALVILAFDVALFFPGSLFNGIIVAHVRYDLAGLLQIGKILLRTGLIIYFVGQGYSIITLAIITLLTNTVERALKILLAKWLYPDLRVSIRLFSGERALRYARYGFYSFVIEAADKIRFNTDIVIIAAILGTAPVTMYNIAARLVQYYMQGIISSINFMLPVFTKSIGEENYDLLRKHFIFSTKLSVILSVMLGGLIALLAEPFISLWIGPEYNDAALPLAILLAGVVFDLAQTPSSTLLFAADRHRFLAGITLVEAIANLCLSLVLVQFYGIIGVALGTSIPLIFLRCLVQPVYVCAQVGVPTSDYARRIGSLAAFAAAIQVPFYLGTRVALDMSLVSTAAWAALAYPAITLLLIRVGLDKDERKIVWTSLASWLRFAQR